MTDNEKSIGVSGVHYKGKKRLNNDWSTIAGGNSRKWQWRSSFLSRWCINIFTKNNYSAFEGIIPSSDNNRPITWIVCPSQDFLCWFFKCGKMILLYMCEEHIWWKTLQNVNVIIIMIIYRGDVELLQGIHLIYKQKKESLRMTATSYASKKPIACCKLSTIWSCLEWYYLNDCTFDWYHRNFNII